MEIIQNETIKNLLSEIGLEGYIPSKNLLSLQSTNHKYIKDLKINVGNVLNNTLYNSKKEAALIAFSVAVNEKFLPLSNALEKLALKEGASQEEIAEVIACTSLLATNNVFYRFRHFAKKEVYNNTSPGIKMSIMMQPVLGKGFFELVSLVVSAVNGCEMCVTSHEQSVLQHGFDETKIFEAIRIASVIKGLITILA